MRNDHVMLPALGAWAEEARCRTEPVPPGFFFPEDGAEALARAPRIALFCRDCPVRVECLDYAVVNLPCGFWGGMSASEVRRVRRRRRWRGTVAGVSSGRDVQEMHETGGTA